MPFWKIKIKKHTKSSTIIKKEKVIDNLKDLGYLDSYYIDNNDVKDSSSCKLVTPQKAPQTVPTRERAKKQTKRKRRIAAPFHHRRRQKRTLEQETISIATSDVSDIETASSNEDIMLSMLPSSPAQSSVSTKTQSTTNTAAEEAVKIRTREVIVRCEKQDICVTNVPGTHEVVHRSHLSQIKKKANTLTNIVKKLESGRYQDNAVGRRFNGAAVASVPKASQDALQTVTPLLSAALCANVGIPTDLEKVAKCTKCGSLSDDKL